MDPSDETRRPCWRGPGSDGGAVCGQPDSKLSEWGPRTASCSKGRNQLLTMGALVPAPTSSGMPAQAAPLGGRPSKIVASTGQTSFPPRCCFAWEMGLRPLGGLPDRAAFWPSRVRTARCGRPLPGWNGQPRGRSVRESPTRDTRTRSSPRSSRTSWRYSSLMTRTAVLVILPTTAVQGRGAPVRGRPRESSHHASRASLGRDQTARQLDALRFDGTRSRPAVLRHRTVRCSPGQPPCAVVPASWPTCPSRRLLASIPPPRSPWARPLAMQTSEGTAHLTSSRIGTTVATGQLRFARS